MSRPGPGLVAWFSAPVALALLAPAATGRAAEPDTAAMTRFVERQLRLSRIPGVAVVVVRGEEVVWAAAFGGGDAPLTVDSPFRIGSVTKTFTALAVAQLADEGRLRYDDPVRDHLPGFALSGEDRGRSITLRHLLTHTSGLKQWSGHDRRAQREALFDHITPARPPGTAFEYSSLNYIILGRVVEAVSGMPYGELLRRHVFEPLEMKNSSAGLDSAGPGRLAQGHRYFFGLTLPGRETPPPGPLVPAGYATSTARDLGRYLGMLLGQGRSHGRKVVSAEALREMFTPWDGGTTGAGMAWGIGRSRIGHAGSTPTFSSRLALLPAEGYGVAVLASVNCGPFSPGTGAVLDGLVRILRGEAVGTIRPDEILLKVGLLVLVLGGAFRTFLAHRRWAARGFPRRLIPSRRVLSPIVTEVAAAAFVLLVLPRWIGVPLPTLLEYFPDLGFAILAGVVTGVAGGLLRSFVLAAPAPAAPSGPPGA